MCEMWNDGDPPTVWREESRRARKEHKCDGCGGRIRIGVPYFRHFSVFDGSTYHEKCCASCKKERSEFAEVPGHYLPMPSSFTEALDECLTDFESTAAEKRKWRGVARNIERRRWNSIKPRPAPEAGQ